MDFRTVAGPSEPRWWMSLESEAATDIVSVPLRTSENSWLWPASGLSLTRDHWVANSGAGAV